MSNPVYLNRLCVLLIFKEMLINFADENSGSINGILIALVMKSTDVDGLIKLC